MRLHEALRELSEQFGESILGNRDLPLMLKAYRAFDELPAMEDVMKSMMNGSLVNELMSQIRQGEAKKGSLWADSLKKSLAKAGHFSPDLAGYAVDSVCFALGLTDSVSEPSHHGTEGAAPGGEGGSAESGQASGENSGSAESAEDLQKKAENGDAGAQARLAGLCYHGGQGVRQDYAKAASWYRKAADQGNAGAQYMLGEMYCWGQGVERSLPLAAKWYLKSAEQGIADYVRERYKATLEFDDEKKAMLAIAERADKKNGGRGMLNIMENMLINPLSEFIFEHEDQLENRRILIETFVKGRNVDFDFDFA